ncbi:uncharacterized protein EURHEDRAFT_548054 [Aspergillus ruber CBS 135680]|uniref:Uncharacterized protein n=1 Tax=Aspergillus ruber (strain CBS 135680) TaxID=1388766 RepID=A0A017SMC4_ASPRC|nr:uncharacterized protein EURHEDRAFT_548054 [Aspergillus ruber CBS 135680]EYE98072.1 hypothetical protein EURHEDRAFT_548054 [Aspergillus ruber CBS 135680]
MMPYFPIYKKAILHCRRRLARRYVWQIFHVHHRGPAAISLGPVPRQHETTSSGEDKDYYTSFQGCDYFSHSLPQAPRLNAIACFDIHVFQVQLEKLTVNAFHNPPCALKKHEERLSFHITRDTAGNSNRSPLLCWHCSNHIMYPMFVNNLRLSDLKPL